MGYLLSIIIPTKNRYKYLCKTVKHLAELDETKVEIVIQDNSENNEKIIKTLEKINHDNIKYFHCTGDLSQTDNSELAVLHATGEYCCYIGDDDVVLPEIIDMVEEIKAGGYEACVCDAATFYWPDVVFERKRAWLKYNTNRYKVSVLNADKILSNSMSWGMQDIDKLPRVYHGIVSKKILEDIHEVTGTYFPGPSPDMANAVSCSLLIDKYIHTEMPLIFSGVGYTSGAGMGQRGEHKGELKNAKQLPKDAEEKWSPRIPKVWLGYTVWAESAEKAMIGMGRRYLIKKINLTAMEAKTFLKYPEYRKMIIERLNNPLHKIRFLYECVRFGFKYIYAEWRLRLRVGLGLVKRFNTSLEFNKAYSIVRKSNQRMIRG